MQKRYRHLRPSNDPATKVTRRGRLSSSFEAVPWRMTRPPPLLRGSMALCMRKFVGETAEFLGGSEPLERRHSGAD